MRSQQSHTPPVLRATETQLTTHIHINTHSEKHSRRAATLFFCASSETYLHIVKSNYTLFLLRVSPEKQYSCGNPLDRCSFSGSLFET